MVRTARRCGWYQEILSVCVCVWRRVVPGVEVWSTECLDGVPARSRQPGSITTSVWSWLNSDTGMEAWGSSGGLEIGHGLGWAGSLMGSWARGLVVRVRSSMSEWETGSQSGGPKVVVPNCGHIQYVMDPEQSTEEAVAMGGPAPAKWEHGREAKRLHAPPFLPS